MIDGTGGGTRRVGEVVESASHRFVAQCYRLYEAPPLGAFVHTEEPSDERGDGEVSHTYAVVYRVSTQALDPGRPVIARGEDEESEEEIYRSNPQLSRLLCTRFEALVVGHGSNGTGVNHYLPPLPPRIHAFVYACTGDDTARFTRSLDFLGLLVSSVPADQGMTDEVVAACLRRAATTTDDPTGFLLGAGKGLAVRLVGDMPRLSSILRRLSP